MLGLLLIIWQSCVLYFKGLNVGLDLVRYLMLKYGLYVFQLLQLPDLLRTKAKEKAG